jgi:hypothetical protein
MKTEEGCCRLEVMYRLSLARRLCGRFSLFELDRWSNRRVEGVLFMPRDEPQLTTRTMMISYSYFITRADKADELFRYACQQLGTWHDSDFGSEFLVKLRGRAATGELIRLSHLGIIGVG